MCIRDRRNTAAERVEHCVYKVTREYKRHLLVHLIRSEDWQQVLVFTRTKHGANRLVEQLSGAGIDASAIHGNKSQAARTKALADFKAKRVNVLVATEVASRGLDIRELPLVLNYELPQVPEDYVHRVGRTARAGLPGYAVSLVDRDEAPLLRDIERLLGRSLPVTQLPEFEMARETAPQSNGAHGSHAAHGRHGTHNAHGAQAQRGNNAPRHRGSHMNASARSATPRKRTRKTWAKAR